MNKINKISGDIVFPDNFQGVKSFEELQQKYTIKEGKNKGKINGLYKKVFERLENFRANLVKKNLEPIDPIKHLYYIYFVKKISIRDLLIETEEIGEDFSGDSGSFGKVMKKNFGWQLRGRTEETPSKLRKDQIKAKIIHDKTEETKKIVDKILYDINIDKPSKITFKKREEKLSKLTKLFFSVGIIEKNDEKYFLKFIKDIMKEENIGAPRISQIIKEIVNNVSKNKFTLNHSSIYHWTKKRAI